MRESQIGWQHLACIHNILLKIMCGKKASVKNNIINDSETMRFEPSLLSIQTSSIPKTVTS